MPFYTSCLGAILLFMFMNKYCPAILPTCLYFIPPWYMWCLLWCILKDLLYHTVITSSIHKSKYSSLLMLCIGSTVILKAHILFYILGPFIKKNAILFLACELHHLCLHKGSMPTTLQLLFYFSLNTT